MKCRAVRLWVRQICSVREIIVLSFCAKKKKRRLFWHFFPIQHEARLENKLHSPSLVFLFAWLRSRSRSRTPSSTQTHRSNNNVRMLPPRNSSSVALLWFYTCLENKFLKLLNSLSRNKDERTIQLARCWLAQWDQYGPQKQLLVLMDGGQTKAAWAELLSLCVCLWWHLCLKCLL